MKKFLLVVLIVLVAIGILAACTQVETIENGISDITQQITDRAIPTWVIIIGAVVLFFIAFGIVWKLIPGFIKFALYYLYRMSEISDLRKFQVYGEKNTREQ